MTKKANAYIAFASLFVVLVLILSFGSQLHGWKLWLAILVSVLFAIWAGATIGSVK
jgi:cell division protein FtsW (lipid II flippase)